LFGQLRALRNIFDLHNANEPGKLFVVEAGEDFHMAQQARIQATGFHTVGCPAGSRICAGSPVMKKYF